MSLNFIQTNLHNCLTFKMQTHKHVYVKFRKATGCNKLYIPLIIITERLIDIFNMLIYYEFNISILYDSNLSEYHQPEIHNQNRVF